MPRLRRFPILVFALVLAASCSPGTSGPIPGPVCGDPPELGYVCPDGVAPACACETHEDGTVQWHCAQCGAIDCASNPNDPVCKADQSCIRCHGLASSEAGTGIENAHPWSYLGCVDCHGGAGVDLANPTRLLTIEESHVHIPHDIAQSGSVTTADRTAYANYYLARSGVENLTGGLDWLRFANPGDLRVVDKTCGKSGCHQATSDAVKRSTMNTIVGKYDALQQGIGIPRASDLIAALGNDGYAKRLATYATGHFEDPNWDKNTSPPGSVPHVHALETVDREGSDPENFTETQMFQEAVNKICGNCHLGQNGNNQQYGNFRASGCTACHMPYKYDGQSNSKDLVINKVEPTYPAAYQQIAFPERPHTSRHVLKRTQTADECLTCHFGSARSVLQYMGIRTDDNRDLKNNNVQGVRYATQLVDNQRDPNARLHSRSEDQLVEYEDLDGNGQDDTPADVHYLAGMECIDCHNTLDMHGDGRIYSRQDQATTVRCVHCHGNLEFDADPDATDNPVNSLFFATNKPTRKVLFKVTSAPGYGEVGYPQVSEPGIWLRTKSRGEWKWVPQIRWATK